MINFHAAGAQNLLIIVFYNAAVSNTACAEQMSLKNTEIAIIQKSLYCDKLFLYCALSFITLFLIRSHIPNISCGFFVAQKACWKGKSLKK